MVFLEVMQVEKSFMYIKNSSRLRFDPCGTTDVRFASKRCPITFVSIVRSVKPLIWQHSNTIIV